jgi:hypothetical protein
MKEREFDRIARSWAKVVDRRVTLRLFAATLLAAGAGWRSVAHGSAQAGSSPMGCSSDEECLADLGEGGCMGAMCLQGECQTFVVDCMPGYTCCNNGSCCPGASPIACFDDADCTVESDDPCQVALCESGQCAAVFVDCAPGTACCGNGECCTVESNSCHTDADCDAMTAGECGKGHCINGACIAGPSFCPPLPDQSP